MYSNLTAAAQLQLPLQAQYCQETSYVKVISAFKALRADPLSFMSHLKKSFQVSLTQYSLTYKTEAATQLTVETRA